MEEGEAGGGGGGGFRNVYHVSPPHPMRWHNIDAMVVVMIQRPFSANLKIRPVAVVVQSEYSE